MAHLLAEATCHMLLVVGPGVAVTLQLMEEAQAEAATLLLLLHPEAVLAEEVTLHLHDNPPGTYTIGC